MLIMTPQEIRKAEDSAASTGLSYEEMMERAGKGCADHIIKNYPYLKNAVILCGKGKNGGDGFVTARYLAAKGIKISVILVFDSPSDSISEKNKLKLTSEIKVFKYSEKFYVDAAFSSADVIIDAVFGIGFKGVLPDHIKDILGSVNNTAAKKIAIDIPSGLSCENFDISNCFRADEILSTLCLKTEHVYKPWSSACGKISVIPIGFSAEAKDSLETYTAKDIKNMLVRRPADSNKGVFGKALIAGGSYNMPGAAVIAAKGALNTGAGLVSLAFPNKCYNAAAPQASECVLLPLESDKNGEFSNVAQDFFADNCNAYDAIAVGCGMGIGTGAEKIINTLIKGYKKTLIIDADGINILSHNINILKESAANIILTPHPGEMSRLTGLSIKKINGGRENIARLFAKEYNVILLLKGANTVIATPDGKCIINSTGSSALARGGSGDLLTGIIASFAAQGMNALNAAAAGAYVHGLAGEKAGERYTEYSAVLNRIISYIPEALSQILMGK